MLKFMPRAVAVIVQFACSAFGILEAVVKIK